MDGQTDVGHINLIGGLVTCNPPKNIKITQPIKKSVVDHAVVKLVFEVRNFKKGPGYWKLNNSILTDTRYLMETKSVRKKPIEEYKSLKSCQHIWELVKVNIKDYTICYCKNKSHLKYTKRIRHCN